MLLSLLQLSPEKRNRWSREDNPLSTPSGEQVQEGPECRLVVCAKLTTESNAKVVPGERASPIPRHETEAHLSSGLRATSRIGSQSMSGRQVQQELSEWPETCQRLLPSRASSTLVLAWCNVSRESPPTIGISS